MNNLIFTNTSKVLPTQTSDNKQKNKIDFKKIKSNTINSLNEVEYFLNDFKQFTKYVKLYKILK